MMKFIMRILQGKILVVMSFFIAMMVKRIGGQSAILLGDDCHNSTSNNNTQTQSLSASYQSNLNELLSWLSTDAATSKGYNHTSVGTAPNDTVYGLYDCRSDDTKVVCQFCVTTATREVVQRCPNRTSAILWYDYCIVRYSNENFIGKLATSPSWHTVGSKDMADPSWEQPQVKTFMKSVIAKATTGPNAELSATGMIDLGGGRKRYGMLQCGRDVNSEECKECGEAMLAKYPSCCQNRQGWQVVAPSCVIKYDDYKFYQSSSSPTSSNTGSNKTKALIISISVSVVVAILCFCVYIFWRRKHVLRKKELTLETTPIFHDSSHQRESSLNTDLPTIPLMVIQQSTYHFSEESKLGEGGFGPVYKGTLPDGREIAVKRLSKTSGQGLEEFKNEVIFIAKLQHRNLVRLLGCCIEENEKILVYEYMANSSLNFHLFNEAKRKKLDWKQRLHIINGIARGLLYLHEDSRLRVIHRDLKASNVLLDHEMNPKISDFGLAKTFEGGESQGNTKRVMGTYGYMSPEYAMEGLFSVKSDVFSFGVLLLEIITGKRNSGFYLSEHGQSLLIYTWKLWCDGRCLELMDPVLEDTYAASEVLKCIHIGLLCVQEDAADRPTMSLVVVMLASDTMTLPNPKNPAFSVGRMNKEDSSTSKNSKDPSVNEVTVSRIVPR